MCWLVHWKSAIFCPSLFIGQRHALLFNIQWIAGSQRSLERCIRNFSRNKPISSKSSNSGIACFNSFWEMSSEQVNHLSRLALFVGAIFVCDFSIVHQYRTQSNQIELHHILRPIVQYYCFHFKSPFATYPYIFDVIRKERIASVQYLNDLLCWAIKWNCVSQHCRVHVSLLTKG